MEPLIRDGATLRIRREGRYRPGDVLVARNNSGTLIVHRLIGAYRSGRGTLLVTRADNASTPDSPIPAGSVIGVVCGGECEPSIVRVPVRCRLLSRMRFARFLALRVINRLATAAALLCRHMAPADDGA